MARKKKTEEVQVTCFDIEAEKKAKVDYGTGWTGKNNSIQAELRGEVEKNE